MKFVIVATLIVAVVASIAPAADAMKPLKDKYHQRPPALKHGFFMQPGDALENPSCVPSIAMIAIDLVSVIKNITTAVGGCKKQHNTEHCAVDLANAVEAVSSLADEIDEAVNYCGGLDSYCADDILAAAHHLSEVADDIAKAVPYCRLTAEGRCSVLISIAMEKLDNVVNDIKKAIYDCSLGSVKRLPEKIVPKRQPINGVPHNPSCASAIGTASVDIAQVIGAINKTVEDCAKPSNTEQCAEDGANTANKIAILAQDLETAAVACGAHESDCGEDILSAAKTITQMSEYVINAIPLCKESIEGECSRIIKETGEDLGEVVVAIEHAIHDCARD